MAWVQNIQEGLVSVIHFEIMFLLGLIAGKTNLFRRLPELGGSLTKWAWLLLPLGLVIKSLSCLDVFGVRLCPPDQPAWEAFIRNLCSGIGTLLMAVAYLIVLSVTLNRYDSRLQRWLGNNRKTAVVKVGIYCFSIFAPCNTKSFYKIR